MYFSKKYSSLVEVLRILSRLFDFRPKHQNIDIQKVKSVLILDYQLIGDIVVSTGFIRDLKIKYPHLEISIKGLPFLKDILKHDNHISNVYFDIGGWLNRWFAARRFNKKFDLVICPRGDIRDIIIGRVYSKKWLISFDFTGGNLFLDAVVPPGIMDHIAKRHIQMGRYLGIYQVEKKYTYELKVPISKEDKYPSNNIAIHIGASRKLRHLPAIELFQIIDYLLEGGYFITFFDAPGLEEGLIRELKVRYNSKNLTIWSGKLTEFILELPKYQTLITTDSAQSHMAAGWGMRTYVLFGPSKLEFCYPYGKEVSNIRKKDVKCSPCVQNQYKCSNSIYKYCYQGINQLFIEAFEFRKEAT